MNIEISTRSARQILTAVTHEKIMEGLAALLRGGEQEITFDLLARVSGVPVRTVYRYFENKEALFAAFWTWVNQAIEMPPPPADAEEILLHIPMLFAAFDRDEALVRAMMHNPHGRDARARNAEARRTKFAVALAAVLDPLAEGTRQNLLATVTVLCSASGWESMKDNWRLSGTAAAEAAQWAVKALLDEAHRNAA